MKIPTSLTSAARSTLLGSLALVAIGTLAAFAQEAAPAAPAAAAPAFTVDKGDTTWMMISTVLVLLMTIPGLALFYGGLVRSKNMLSVLMQVFTITAVVMLIWVFYGYSLAFTPGNSFIGGLSKAFLQGVDVTTMSETFTKGVAIPELVYVVFQMTFACITPALIVGAFAERVKFSAVVLFVILWVTFVYFPIAHMVWFWGGPSAYSDPSGLIFSFGAIDFAGGTVVHINAGIAGLVGAIMVGKRTGYKKDIMAPHSMTMTMIGASLLWVGWFGFNAGSNLEANAYAGLAMINTFVATAAAAVMWIILESFLRGKASMLGAVSGAVAGLVAVTPAAGFVGPMGAIVLGAVVTLVCYFFVAVVKNTFDYDDSLDVFGIHCVGGIIGALGTGILVNPALGGAGIVDYSTADFAAGYAGTATQVWAQFKGVAVTLLWSGIGSAILYKIVDLIVGLRASPESEREGLDLTSHGEAAYHS
ncbi:ammonium transporter [Phyllobacterium endophyticum]|jgi:Amt family ammonium transporter|uniref:Ammonium transporter n=1 Tax=Phyllobacterium endophyticum TaxID=1149773 RepID=A0A2P7AYY8_9HYPH|nr:ammonium transporter [Phyllobacterium endophyticum]MBB3236008.1 Amt family ammonium transporter [Phyllobacterium endophyticum]PSH59419.1 ammonia channel protein [Phyllobacterium endophyticum]TXR50323.1 ammonium transporter [Phyllobacterium endophyticum]TYR41554.1 ammonium transporter [Phyllobacterium endophyticum]